MWDSRDKRSHYIKADWPVYLNFSNKNIGLTDPKDVFLPPLHINQGLIKNFDKTMNQVGHTCQKLKDKFPRFSGAQVMMIFVEPQMR